MKQRHTLSAVVALAFIFIQADSARAQNAQASAKVNGLEKITVGNNQRSSSSRGVSIAAAEVFNPVKSQFRVSSNQAGEDRAADTTTEVPKLQKVIDTLSALPAATDAATTTAFKNSVFSALGAVKPSATPQAFTLLPKRGNDTLQAEATGVANPGVAEAAQATANQKVSPSGLSVDFTQTPVTSINKQGAVGPAAVAFGLNIDPYAVDWTSGDTSLAELRITLQDQTSDPSNPLSLSLTAEATPGSRAAAFYNLEASYLNFNSFGDIPIDPDAQDALESSSQSLFDLSIMLLNVDGLFSANFFLNAPSSAVISDTFGDTSVSAVLDRLRCQSADGICPVSILNGTLSFNSDFAITMRIPGDPASSLLFIRDEAAAVSAVPEPATVLLLLGGLTGLMSRAARRRRIHRG